ncbi:alpha/beta hydrolase [Aspergillus aculeatinus CBS 121060]|uniref:Alpha/beta-hydrolase n=1 Tax=Aspergillus aculeatinus CBS 121060 TaxID=1448322 RepID=A0ACD1GU60_9EURO|nr:alpha/beta-hydrolase [Aspergillus aculeatinus CBS 121060]RAH64882.1 alpha/beta-hydrolase [Aspergillus aculeatinus CBS 121060]
MAWYNQTVDSLSDFLASHRSQLPLLAATGASLTAAFILRSFLSDSQPEGNVYRSPLDKVKALSDAENRELPLPIDVLPGARDVPTSFGGSMRVYEWGPEEGPRVLLIHGITTPCIALGGLAHALVDRGCRVMLFDLFGRGYSDCPSDLPQDGTLWNRQIWSAINSSPIFKKPGDLCLVGYSLGGGIAANFAAFHPQAISSLVLLAPAGLIRDSRISFQSQLLYSHDWIPEKLLKFFVRRRLRAGPLTSKPANKKLSAEDALVEELPNQGATEVQRLSRAYPHVNVPSTVKWQVDEHPGFVHAFMSSMRFGPILQQRQLKVWKQLGDWLAAGKKAGSDAIPGLPHDKVLIMYGEHDAVIVKDDLVPDATAALQGLASFKSYDAGHEFPSTKYDDVAQYMMEFLQLNASTNENI